MRNKVLFLVLLLSMITQSLAWSENTFNNSKTEEELYFNSINFTRWIEIPSTKRITHASINLTGPQVYLGKQLGTSSTFGNPLDLDYDDETGYIRSVNGDNKVYIDYFSSSPRNNLVQAVGIAVDEDYDYIADRSDNHIRVYLKSTGAQVDDHDVSAYTSKIGTLVYADGHILMRSLNNFKVYVFNASTFSLDANYVTQVNYPPLTISNGSIGAVNEKLYTLSTQGISPPRVHYYTNAYGPPSTSTANYFTADASNTIGNGGDYVNNTLWFLDNDSNIYKYGLPNLNNPEIKIGINKIWNSTGDYNTSSINNLNLVYLNNYLDSCVPISGNCYIPLSFNSEENGFLTYSDLVLNDSGGAIIDSYNKTPVIEGSYNIFNLTIVSSSDVSISSAELSYGALSYSAQISRDGYESVVSKGIYAPNVDAQENITWNWIITFSDGYVLTTSEENQTVNQLSIDNCTLYSTSLYNFSLKDEETQSLITSNGTIEVAFNIYNSNRNFIIANYSEIFENTNDLKICLGLNYSELDDYSLDGLIRYDSENHANEYYNLYKVKLNSSSTSEQINLFDLNDNETTEFRITFLGEDFLPVEDALIFINRQYLSENTFKTVELPKTDFDGQAVVHLVRNDLIYNFNVYYEGSVYSFNNRVAFCSDPTFNVCEIRLSASEADDLINNYNEELGIIFTSPTYDANTTTVSFNFNSLDGSTKTINLNVERRDIFGNNSLCSNSIVSSGGTVSCNVGSISETQLVVRVDSDGEVVIEKSIGIEENYLDSTGALFAMILNLGLILAFAKSKNGVLLATSISYISAVGFGFVQGGIIGIGTAGIWMISVTLVALWKLNKRRSD